MKTFQITLYNKTTATIDEIYYKEFSSDHDAISYCRGRCSDTHNALYEERKGRRGEVYAKRTGIST